MECKQFDGHQNNLNNSLQQEIARLTSSPLGQISVKQTDCTTGQRPFCGVDVEKIREHHRARRLVGGRMKGKSTKNKNNGGYNSYRETVDLTCEALSANITVSGQNLTLLEMSLDLLRHLQANNSLIVHLWDGQRVHSSFMLSAAEGSSYSLHEAPVARSPHPLPTESLPPLEVNLTPMIYAGAGILGLVCLCVLWKFIKHSWLLYRKRFTAINSDRVDHRKAQQLQRITEAMEENDSPSAHGKRGKHNTVKPALKGNSHGFGFINKTHKRFCINRNLTITAQSCYKLPAQFAKTAMLVSGHRWTRLKWLQLKMS